LLSWIDGTPPPGIQHGFVLTSVRDGSGSWSTPVQVAGPNDEPDGDLATLSDSGEGVVTWWSMTPTGSEVRAAVRSPGGSWAASAPISAGLFAGLPRLAGNGHSDDVVVFEDSSDGTAFGVAAVTRLAGGAWTAPVEVVTPGNGDAPDVAIDAFGTATATWTAKQGSQRLVRSATHARAGAWQAPDDVSSLAPGAVERSRVASNRGGDAVAVWGESTPLQPESLTRVSVRPLGGAWSTPMTLSLPQQRTLEPVVDLDETGHAAVAWRLSRSGGPDVDENVQAVLSPAPPAPPPATPTVVIPAFTG
jgi:hypothetical protein